MDFLYRMHLVDFDILKKKEILKNWEWIKQAIRLSSDSLYQEIEFKEYDALTAFSKSKIQKYLLRGRYRATPFGLWAGVGIGVWDSKSRVDSVIQYHAIQCNTNSRNISSQQEIRYKLAPGLIRYKQQIHYWSYCLQEEGWRVSYLDRNVLVDRIGDYLQSHGWIHWGIFCSFFESRKEEHLKRYWALLLDSGILISEDFPNPITSSPIESCDIKIQSRIQVSCAIKDQLDQLSNEIGNLFVPLESELLSRLKKWFFYHFDDRWVSLESLSKHPDLITLFEEKARDTGSETPKGMDFFKGFWKGIETLDLSEWVEEKPLEVQHLQLAFKLINDSEVFVENIVCNRAFAYTGRFSKDPEIYSYLQSQVEPDSESLIKADVLLWESTKANILMQHRNVFDYAIYPFGATQDSGYLDTEDLLLGLKDHQLILFSKRLQCQVAPSIQHPLNPEQISHPLSRILYEISNQNQVKFIPYYDSRLVDQAYVPRLTWKGIILQGRRWILESKAINSKKELLNQINILGLPCPILAGHLDRELLLHWNEEVELGFLWEELQRQEKLTLFECPWYQNSPFRTESGQMLYPQLVYAKKGLPAHTPTLEFLNQIYSSDINWLYVRIFVRESGIQAFLKTTFPKIIGELQVRFGFDQWYFLIYSSPKLEVRLRIKCPDPEIQEILQYQVQVALSSCGWVDRMSLVPYYPEFDKYGTSDLPISEAIFSWESIHFLLSKRFQNFKDLQEEANCKKAWIIRAFTALVQKKNLLEPCYRYFQETIKHTPTKTRKKIRKLDHPPLEQPEETEEIIAYSMLYQELNPGNEEKLVFLLSNHLHMCCNRAFPIDSSIWELGVVYGLCKELGRLIYTGEGKVPVFNKRSR